MDEWTNLDSIHKHGKHRIYAQHTYTDTYPTYINNIHLSTHAWTVRQTERRIYTAHIYMIVYIPYTVDINSIHTQYTYIVYNHSAHKQVICSILCLYARNGWMGR